jgi:hypothetical protein
MRYLASFIVGILLAAGVSSAWNGFHSARAPMPFPSMIAVSDWMTRYYQAPQPQRLPEAVAALRVGGAFDDPVRFTAMVGFFAGVLETDATAFRRLSAGLRAAPTNQQKFVALAVALSGRHDWRERLTHLKWALGGDQPAINQLLEFTTPLHVLHLPLDRPEVLDMQWAYFMATGKREPVERVISVVSGTLQRDDVARMMIGYAAKWSLAANAGAHPKVLEVCRSAAASEEPVATVLKDVVAAAEVRNTMPDTTPQAWKHRHLRRG